MHFSPRPYQQLAIDRMLGCSYQLIALQMGAGKTVSALSVIEELMYNRFEVGRTLVVAPKRVAELVWHVEAAKWDHTRDLRVQRVLGSARDRAVALDTPADIYVINRENFPWLVEHFGDAWPFDCVIIDENRGFKERSSKSWRALKAIRSRIKRLYMLSGTPSPNSLMELWPQVSVLDGGVRLGRSLTSFRDRWFLPDKRNGQVVYSWRLKPSAEAEIYAAVADVMLSVEGDMSLPPRLDNVILVRFDMSEYRQLAKEMTYGEITAANAGVLAGKLAQMANGAVYDAMQGVHRVHDAKLDALAEIAEQGEPVLVFTSYRHDQQRILATFPDAVVFDGEGTLARWQRGEISMLLMHPASGGHGVDGLQVGGRVAVWFGLPFSLDLYAQANARLYRSGQRQSVVIHHLVAAETIDETIMSVLATKGDMQRALLDAVRVVGSSTLNDAAA
jgi:SNF2 family DNA or RNA helicase